MSVLIPNSIGSYQFVKKIGEGSFAEVWSATHVKSGLGVAIKVINKAKFKEPKHLTRFNRELSFMKQIEHPLIAQLYESLEDENNHYLVMEYAEGDNLLQYINTDGKLAEPLARQYFIQLISVVEYLHKEKNIIHRDLKAENVLLDRHYNIRLIDFGLSNSFSLDHTNLETACGSPGYLPPEMIKGQTHTTAADIWSLGVLLYVIVVGHLPFEDPQIPKIFDKIVNATPFYPRTLSADLSTLLKKMLVKEPENRITLDEIKAHPWFSMECYNYANGRLTRTLPLTSPGEYSVISPFVLDEDALEKMKNLGYNPDGMETRLMTREFDEESAIYLMISKSSFTDNIRDIRDVGIRLDGQRVISFLRTRAPSFGSANSITSAKNSDHSKPLVAPRQMVRQKSVKVSSSYLPFAK